MTDQHAQRRDWMGELAKAAPGLLAARLADLGPLPGFTWLRPPETGAVMVRGRTGGTGAPFNIGEMSVTRCTLRLETGETGHGWVQGRNKTHAEQAALVDALMQTDRAERVRRQVLAPLAKARAARRAEAREKAAATKVDFFTLVRGED